MSNGSSSSQTLDSIQASLFNVVGELSIAYFQAQSEGKRIDIDKAVAHIRAASAEINSLQGIVQ